MYDTTRKWIERRATESGLDPEVLGLDPKSERETHWEIYISYAGKEDEQINLADTIYGVNICDWLAEQCAYESACNGGGDEWFIEMYPAMRFTFAETPMYRTSDVQVPASNWMCTWNSGGDPGQPGCEEYANGIDGLCSTHRAAHAALVKSAPAE